MEEQLLEFIKDTIFQVTGQRGMDYETDFVKDLGLTSFDVMNIVCIFEDHDVISYMIQRGITQV